MESIPHAGSLLTSIGTVVCVVTLLTLCLPAHAVSTVSRTNTPLSDTPLSTSIQPSFSSSLHPGSSITVTIPSSGLQTHGTTDITDLLHVSSSSDTYISEPVTGETFSQPFRTTSPSLSVGLDINHVSSLSVSQSDALSAISTTTLVLEPARPTPLSSVVESTTVPGSSYSPEVGGMNKSTTTVTTVSSQRTTVVSNDSVTKTTLDGIGGGTTTTTSPIFGNGSCSGNNTGCPEYNGRINMELSTPAIIGIAVGAAVLVIVVACMLIFMCRRRRTLSGSKADLSTYWDDNVTLSYINGHLDYPKDLSDEMVSLDNDSFLNSLDSMSFSNVWAGENAKHTNF
ncbi:flocculation protein FLO11-like isoform X2 [Haliotis rubra]|uniref:flocculation protein FLO11-like isoform X2 n=1 Tax=Haliotis rubra TaxID=36100 RepID=UPI001EE5AEB0|nr:flocculation protein FLO11-like isoform X2 [Haliotis rubra]XP_046565502.1 flocculation protein FLO11-like isoform X2 [Haliotis rubra]XP_046565503.1 flocculation protein FLO11-like isoform X2 [Haliotis rubra]